MKVRQRIQKADESTTADDQKATHRLTGITVKEVSIVDRGANKRKYLVVKDEEGAEKADPPAPPAPPTAPAPPSQPAPPTLKISPELKAKVTEVLRNVQTRIGIISKVLEGSSETPGAPAPQELMTALAELVKMIQEAAPAAPPATPPVPPAPNPNAPPAQKQEGKEEGKEEGKAEEKPEEKKDEANKAGKKISTARLGQLQAMQAQLNSFIAEVSGGDPEEKPAEGGETPPAEENTEKSAAPSKELVEMQTVLSGLVTSVDKMTKVFEAQNARIDTLSKSRGGSQQADLDTPPPRREERVVWDLDMAKPHRSVQ